eukprot:scaffold2044_cov202-Prasinococcus_capsulatus_cf.AAC.4
MRAPAVALLVTAGVTRLASPSPTVSTPPAPLGSRRSCPDYTDVCVVTPPPLPPNPPPPTCADENACGGSAGGCWCDSSCTSFADCTCPWRALRPPDGGSESNH